ncbi:hypothetical protein C7444_12113 [Sphaerotilus hippei]|uniref:GDSL-like lipase/acylhydrolase family protein n=1 Tax=Sphaerotilus hippei TaxID=744406 RepID=A0A318GXN1_9BURK|nr:hypothetical protein [Sphaerotilus hippei]PXW93249.1 hypothetical protein C7444_12113 [Sphaerotilus hippei]
MKFTLRKKWAVAGSFIALLLFAEVAARLSGVIDFPLYLASSEIGYEFAPNQSGTFLGGKRWNYNEYGMGSGPFLPKDGVIDILLVGDSVVLGGNKFDMSERLGAQLERELGVGYKVWPISAGSWALLNELAWMRHNKAVVEAVDTVVIVSNAGDFAVPSSWSCEETHPRSLPYSALVHLVKKYSGVIPLCTEVPPKKLLFRDRSLTQDLIDFSVLFSHKTVAVYYPNKGELLARSVPSGGVDVFQKTFSSAGVRIIDGVLGDKGWGLEYYGDDVHPNSAGYGFMAKYLSLALKGHD